MSTLASVFGYGLLSARAAASVAGRFYYATDTTLMYRDNGSTWDSLAVGTGSMATDALWDAAGDLAVGTGANTGAKLTIGAAGAGLSVINSAVAWNAGTSFPASKATNDRYYRTDLREEYGWDGTQWRCTTVHEMTMGGGAVLLPNTANGAIIGLSPSPYLAGGTDLYLLHATFLSFVSATNNGTNYWTLNFNKITGANAATTIASRNTSADTQANWIRAQVSIAAVLGTVATYPAMDLAVSLTLSPGSIYASVTLAYNHVAT